MTSDGASTIRILIVDDSPEDRFVYRRLLSAGTGRDHEFEINEVGRGDEALAVLETEDPDCVLLDYNLPDCTGLDILDDLVGEGATPSVAIVMLTGQGNEQIAVDAMKRGVQDYLIKGSITQESLVFAIHNAIEKVALRRELDQHRMELMRSNRELERFAAVVAHDLQNPLATLHTLLQAVDADHLPEIGAEKQEFVRGALAASDRMQSLIVELLDYSRLGGQARDVTDVPTAEVFEDVLRNLEALIRSSGARITCDQLPIVHGDRAQLLQVFQNLVANGIKYHGEGHPVVHVSHDGGPQGFTFRVTDQGAGIEPTRQEDVFGAFCRLHRNDEIPGHGLGLAICRKVVEQHGGTIGLESEVGAGTTVWFTLPG